MINQLRSFFVLGFWLAAAGFAHAQGTAFTYQGRLTDNGSAYTGTAEFQATLWSVPNGGTALATNSPPTVIVPVNNGLFVLPLDFGANFHGANRWLQLEVRTSIGAFNVLSPRQPITPSPYAITASNVTGTLPAAQLSGTVADARLTANVSLLGASIESAEITDGTIVNADVSAGAAIADTKLATIAAAGKVANSALSSSVSLLGPTIESAEIANGTIVAADVNAATFSNTFWQAAGNAGTTTGTHFLGTTDNRPLEIKVNGQRALRIEPATNSSYGSSPNMVGGFSGNIVSNGVVGAVIGGGGFSFAPNLVGGEFATVVGGFANKASGFASTAMGGYTTASAHYSTAMGYNTTASNQFSTAMGYNTTAGAESSTAMGSQTTASGFMSTAMGSGTTAIGESSTAMGFGTTASGDSTTAMGHYTTASGHSSTAMGSGATAAHLAATAMGLNTTASGSASTAMGRYTTASGAGSTAMGSETTASGLYSTAMGHSAKANHTGAFVYADSQPADFASTASDQFSVRANGGVRLDGNIQIGLGGGDYQHLRLGGGNSDGFLYGSFPLFGDGIHLGYNYYADAGGVNRVIHQGGGTSRISAGYSYIGLGAGGVGAAPLSDQLVVSPTSVTVYGTFNNNSDRNAKQDLKPVNPAEILDKVIQLPLSEWSYKTDATTRHLGPMAQDFYAAFNVGTDDRHIAPIDEGGVALAAIQGLNQRLTEELKRRDAENAALKHRLEKLEQLLDRRHH